ncbi:reticulocyte-binding protein 2 homolog a [Hyposmocoma kahamanoa]|uniref:reticulocyte-binding protein 2 homolog a n=1 Tax=Hyposmocoma kahamanoa TaxID=1477025 RepID=UPI000E6D99CB|nr:reticulocyte-binding protein 2 homolog a [Hyposmocoma kahamanoa]
MKLKDTEQALRNINSIFMSTTNTHAKIEVSDPKNEAVFETVEPSENTTNENNSTTANDEIPNAENRVNVQPAAQKFDEKMEQTLHTALENIFEISNDENQENKELEFKEMKNLARNIVEGAENLSTLIREDITNKLNSMNELLNDVNQALENSKQSNIAYQKIKEEGEALQRERSSKVGKVTVVEVTEEKQEDIINASLLVKESVTSGVTNSEIDDIRSAISKLNAELVCHEDRINESKQRYEMRNKECKDFIDEVSVIMQKSREILHPKEFAQEKGLLQQKEAESVKQMNENGENKHTRDLNIDLESYKCQTNKRLEEFKKQESERSKRIDNLLHEIKDKMKDNKEVLRLANNLLRREENKKKVLEEHEAKKKTYSDYANMDSNAQGDHEDVEYKSSYQELKHKIPLISEIPPIEGVVKGISPIEKMRKEQERKKKEEEEKEKQRQREYQIKLEKELEEMNKAPRMTKAFIKDHCRQHKLYYTPHLNDILYLHFKGFAKIENLEEYTGLKCIFLENNGIQRIEGLDTLSELKCLYLHYNIIRKIENLQGCAKLDTLNLDHNFVGKIENLDQVPVLHTLSMAHNMLATVDDIIELKFCTNLSVLDLSYNRIDDPLIIDVLSDMAILKVLVLTGNPVVRNIPAYRKTLTLRLKELLNLDNRPVFPRDRACAEAWQRGGVQEEIAERRRWIARDQEKVMESVRYLIRIRDENKAKREQKEKEEREKLGLPPKNESEEDIQEDNSTVSRIEIEGPSTLEEKFGGEVVTKSGMPVDMLSGSEAESSSDSSSDDSDDGGKEDETETGNIEWSGNGKQLVQEVHSENPPPPEEYWHGYRGVFNGEPTCSQKSPVTDIEAIHDMLFNQQPHVDSKRRITKILDDRKNEKRQMKSPVVDELASDKENVKKAEEANKKPLIEILESYQDNPKDPKTTEETESVDLKTVKITNKQDKKSENNDYQQPEGVVREGDTIIDHDKKLLHDLSNENNRDITSQLNKKSDENKKADNLGKPMKKINILEIKATESKSIKTKQVPIKEISKTIRKDKEQISKNIMVTEMPKTKNDSKKNVKDENQKEKSKETKKEEKDASKGNDAPSAAGSQGSGDSQQSPESQIDGDSNAFLNYMRRMNDPDFDVDEGLNLEPSAEDLEIFAELDREQEERQRRIDRGEPPVDPMKLYDKKTMDEFYKQEERVPAHEIKEKTTYTTYRLDNAFDRVALSQLTEGDRPDANKVKLTHVPGAILFQYVDQQKPAEIAYEIGEEQKESDLSSGETESINISSEDSSLEQTEDAKDETLQPTRNLKLAGKDNKTKTRDTKPTEAAESDKKGAVDTEPKDGKKSDNKGSAENTKKIGKYEKTKSSGETRNLSRQRCKSAKSDTKLSSTPKNKVDGGKKYANVDDDPMLRDEKDLDGTIQESEFEPTQAPYSGPTTSYDMMIAVDRNEAKKNIIGTFNSYADKRYPSQGVNYSDMSENARIDDSVANEILERTLRYEEQELYRQYDYLTSHAGKVDNRTNTIIEHMSDQLSDQCSRTDVCRMIEAHIESAEQLWRAGEYERYIPVSPTESDTEPDNEPTLVPSHDTSFEDTLTEDNVQAKMEVIQEDVNIDEGNGSIAARDCNRDGNEKVRDGADIVSTYDTATDGSVTSRDELETARERGASDLDGNEDVDLDGSEVVIEDVEQSYMSMAEDMDEAFEDCVSDEKNFDRIVENYSLEMKLALGIDNAK